MKIFIKRRISAVALAAVLSTAALAGNVVPASAASTAQTVKLASSSASKLAAPNVRISVSYPSKTKAAVKLSWSKISGASGYQILYGGNSSMTVDDGSCNTTAVSKTFTSTRSSKVYNRYFKVRAYKTVNGTKVYCSWSAVKSVSIARKYSSIH